MKLDGSTLLLTATDLGKFSACRHATLLDREVAHGRSAPAPYRDDPALRLLQDRGRQHEARYREVLERRHGEPARTVLGAPPRDEGAWRTATAATLAAMQAGHRVIVQAPLSDGPWCGRADFLERVDHRAGEPASLLGEYHYRAIDTKLAQVPRGTALLQLCVYTELVGRLQGRVPDDMVVVSPAGARAADGDGVPVATAFRTADFAAYFRRLRRRLESFVQEAPLDAAYPEPCDECDLCSWWSRCEARRREDDHLSFVAGMTRRDQSLLEGAGIGSLARLGRLPLPMVERPRKLHAPTLERLQHQARLQLAAREGGPVFELLRPVLPGKGLTRLPEPSPGDLFFDVEVDRYAPDGTFVYLFGWVELDSGGRPHFERLWATHRGEERRNFESFVEHVRRRRESFPDLHVFHFAALEKTVLGELASRYASHEDDVDELFRQEVLCDLLPVVKQSLRAGVEDYSLKALEVFHGFARTTDLRAAAAARRLFELGREGGGTADLPEVMTTIERYNHEDCASTHRLRDWLEERRSELLAAGEVVERQRMPDKEPGKKLSEWLVRVEYLRGRLLDGVPANPAEHGPGHRARQLLADVLDWHRRKEKPAWREYFRVRQLTAEECFQESAPIGNLGPEQALGASKRSQLYAYRYPPQEHKLRAEDVVECPVTEQALGEVVEVRREENVIVVKRTRTLAQPPVAMAKKPQDFLPGALQDALAEVAESLAATGFGLPREPDEWGEPELTYPTARALLLREAPRLAPGVVLVLPDESAAAAAVRVVAALRQTVLAVQGPPGAGKSHTGARMILALLEGGKRVGITATSHKVIGNLLAKVHEAASEKGERVRSVQKVTTLEQGYAHPENQVVEELGPAFVSASAEARRKNPGGGELLAGTAHLWAHKSMRQRVDVLVVDEAGQFSLANALVVSVAADSLVLLGDPRQLSQPDQGSHPPGADASALEHLLEGQHTISADRGIFLDQTWRLPPSIARFTSEYFYSGRLKAHPDCERQVLRTSGTMSRYAGAGLFFEALEHRGNTSASSEEAARVVELVAGFLEAGTSFVQRSGVERVLTVADIVIVAPYNLQVQLIREELGKRGLSAERVGTVDKFQGQEAPIVIYSMTTSGAEEMPRNMEFLFDPRRLNVATSRAQAVAIVVASKRLLEAECHTPEQMRLLNALCGAVDASR